jgi:L-ascorbate metabolism protein UlaG (beta-lactamase superfamily)
MRVASLGHAGLYVETADQRLLVDPVFAETLADGVLRYAPRRRLHLDKMPPPTALIVTHAHFDHYHRASLERLPRDLPVVVPEDHELIDGLRSLGFTRLTICAPWASALLGKTRVLATPSDHDEPEMGVVISDGVATFWHMADAEVTRADGARVLREHGRVDIVSAKYQPVVRASMGYQRTRGASFDKAEVAAWLEAACAVEPGLVFPYASGLAFAGRHEWFNRYAFPLSEAEVVDLLCRRLGPDRSVALLPGDAVDASNGGRPVRVAQVLPFVEAVAAPPIVWEPVDLSTLAGLEDSAARKRLTDGLDRLLEGPIARWFGAELDRSDSAWWPLRDHGVVWQLVLEAGGGERIERHIDLGASSLVVHRGRHPLASSFTHVSGRALLDVLEGKTPGLVFWLAGDARSYEKTFVVRGARIVAPPMPAPEDEIGDPLTYFLRHFGPNGEGIASAPVAAAVAPARLHPSDLEVLVRQGENRAVVAKKALLGMLAEREAERIGMVITDADVTATSDSFRARFGQMTLEDAQRWQKEAGLTDEEYAAVMHRFTAVRMIEDRYTPEVDAILDEHTKIASARRGEG